MTTTAQIDAFLACRRIGFAGVSTNPDDFSRAVFRELVARGYEVVPIHPTADDIEGHRAYATVTDAAPLDAVYIMTPPVQTEQVMRDCHRSNISRVWVHRGVGGGAVDRKASAFARAHRIDLIDGECILMFLPHTHALHRAHGQLRRMIGHYPEVTEDRLPHRARHAIGYGVIAWALAVWAMLAIGGLFDWKTGLASRLVLLPAMFGLLGWLHAGPGRLAPLPTAAVFAAVTLVLDAIFLGLLVERSFAMFASFEVTWLPLALAFVTAVITGTWHSRPFTRPLGPAAHAT